MMDSNLVHFIRPPKRLVINYSKKRLETGINDTSKLSTVIIVFFPYNYGKSPNFDATLFLNYRYIRQHSKFLREGLLLCIFSLVNQWNT